MEQVAYAQNPRMPATMVWQQRLDAWTQSICIGLAIAAFIRWILPLRSPLWLDETNTWWLIRQGAPAIVRRANEHFLSYVYGFIAWGATVVLGDREWAVRLPSLLAAAGAAYLLYRLARRLYDREFALIAVVIFMIMHQVAFAAIDARPYAFGLLSMNAAALFLIRWTEKRTMSDAAAFGATLGFALDMHIFFAILIGVFGLYLGHLLLRGKLPTAGQLAAAVAAGLVAGYPALLALTYLLRPHEPLSFASTPSIRDLTEAILPAAFALSLVLAGALFAAQPISFRFISRDRSQVMLILAWALLPPVTLFAMSVSTSQKVFLSRYLLVAAPGLALLLAAIARSLEPRGLRVVLLLCFAVLNWSGPVLAHRAFLHEPSGAGNWKAALAQVDAETRRDGAPVLIRSQYINSDAPGLDWRSRPLEDDFNFSPLGYYHSNSRFQPIPVTFRADMAKALQPFLQDSMNRYGRVLLVSADGPRPLQPYLSWIQSSFCPVASGRVLGEYDRVLIYEFRSRPPG